MNVHRWQSVAEFNEAWGRLNYRLKFAGSEQDREDLRELRLLAMAAFADLAAAREHYERGGRLNALSPRESASLGRDLTPEAGYGEDVILYLGADDKD